MGVEIGRIEKEFVLNAVFEKQIPINVHGQKKERTGIISSVSETEIEIESRVEGWDDFKVQEPIRVFFAYYGHVMTFNALIKKINEVLTVSYPVSIYKNLQRKYERVPPPEGSAIHFQVADLRVELDYPKTEDFDPVVKPELSEQFDPHDIDEMIANFRRKIDKYADENRIQMFREKRPESTEEVLVAQTARIVFVPDTTADFPEDDILWDGRVLTRESLQEIEQTGLDEKIGDFNSHRLTEFLQKRNKEGIQSFLYCPIIYHEYVVGYIKLVCHTDTEDDKKITPEAVDFIYEFSRVLAYSLKIHGYFKSTAAKEGKFKSHIIDISASGLLFVHSSQTLRTSLNLYRDLELTLSIPPRNIKVDARIMRKFSEKELTYYGVQYIKIDPEDFRHLFDIVYGRPFAVHDEEKWEGGAEPPELSLDL